MELAERAEGLAQHVLGPLVLGGEVRPQRPFGPKLGLAIGEHRTITDPDLERRVDEARLRVARTLVPVDAAPSWSPAQWAIGAAFNDLLQVTNHELSSFATRTRHEELLASTMRLTEAIPPCADLAEAVGRHATFSRALEVRRVDTHVSWWTGSDTHRGQPPPARLLAWPDLRRVRVREEPVELPSMDVGVPVDGDRYLAAVDAWLSTSPLTDLGTAFRAAPPFVWTAHTVGMVATVAGSNLALRALSVATDDDPEAAEAAIAALSRSASQLGEGPAKRIATQYTDWTREAKTHWAELG